MSGENRQLVLLKNVYGALSEAVNINDIKDVIDKAEAVRRYVQSAGLSRDTQRTATVLRLRAEHRAGQLLAEMKLPGGNRRSKSTETTLNDLGITKDQSSKWQRISTIPEAEFEHFLDRPVDSLSTKAAVRLANELAPRKEKSASDLSPDNPSSGRYVNRLETLVDEGASFSCIYANPPWRYKNAGTRAAAEDHYPTMSVEELCQLPVESLAAEECHLHLWTTNAFLFESRQLVEAWGFQYKSCFVWTKPTFGLGNYWRVAHEFLVLGVRGKKAFADRSIRSWAEINRKKHSEKPHEIRNLIERVSLGDRLELFGRQQMPGWTVVGNHIDAEDETSLPDEAIEATEGIFVSAELDECIAEVALGHEFSRGESRNIAW